MTFELDQAEKRLQAVEEARMLLDQAASILVRAKVKNSGVAKAIIMCKKELTDFRHMTNFAIAKRKERERAHHRTAH